MSAKKQYGKGLSGFMLGLLLATAVIAGVLFFLNKSNKEAFKEETQKELPKPEILTPKSSEPAAPPAASAPVDTASDVLGGFIEDRQTASEPATTAASDPVAPDASAAVPPQTAVKPKTEQKPAVKKPEAKPKPKPETKKEQPKKEEQKKTAKPTPEQILDSGSIEKARENARAEAAKKETAKKESAKKADSGKQSAAEGGRTVLQMGSFNNRESAEAHRAKLAMMGVSSSVVEGEANGKSVYRVQSGRMSSDAARRTQQTLKRNGVDSFARSVK